MANINHKQIINEINQLGIFGAEFNVLQRSAAQLQVLRDSVSNAIDCEAHQQDYFEINKLFDELTMALLNQAAKVQCKTYIENRVV